MRYGLIADIHGNRWALDAVLFDARRRGVDRWFDVGDCVYGPLDPAGTARRLRELGALTVRGNQDRVLAEPPDPPDATFRFVHSALSPDELSWLGGLPRIAQDGPVFLCHGTPRDDEEPLLEHIDPHGVSLRKTSEVAESLKDVEAEVVVCGHTHVARLLQIPDGPLVINPGSVGLPAYTDDLPFPHAMEAGSPHARYAILQRSAAGWSVEQHAVAYATEDAAFAAESNGRPDWARRLISGRA